MKQKYIDEFWLWIKIVILATVLVFLIKGFIFIPTMVEGNSMKETLKPNDYIIFERLTSIHRFDVVVIQTMDGATLVKRVVGLPGEHIRYTDDKLYINEVEVEEPFLKANKKENTETGTYTTNFNLQEITGLNTLPADGYFVLGDNRRLSKDSRSFGVIKEASIIGKARWVYYPLENFGIVK